MKEQALKRHKQGKIAITSTIPLDNPHDLALAYTPGVAFPSIEIAQDQTLAYEYTSKGHMVLIVTDGTAVLGLGDIGPHAALPVMEGKALLVKKFAGLDAFPICLDTKDTDKIIEVIKLISPGFGGILLEDISAPRCVDLERRLQAELNLPVFHDDQHGTAIVVGAAIINASRLLKKPIDSMKVVVSGVGAAGSSVIRMLKRLGAKDIYAYQKDGAIDVKKYDQYHFVIQEMLDEGIISSPVKHDNTLACLMVDSDVFIGVSAPGIVSQAMVASMKKDAIIFALANPIPEIMPEDAKNAGARIIGTGRSDFPNQVNNVLAFPGIFKGALQAKAKKITEEMKEAAVYAIADLINIDELSEEYVIPSVFDPRVADAVSEAIIQQIKNQELHKKG